MQQIKPTFIIRKYRSILTAAIVVESVNYIISLTDSIIAGNMLGGDALVAIGLLAPFLSLSLFMSSIINSGTIMQYSSHIGAFRKERALEFFSLGVYMALLTGAAYAAVLLASRNFIIARLSDLPLIREYMKVYFNTIILFFLMNPLSYLLDNAVIADGAERLSAASNVVFIVSNIALSYLLAHLWGIRGVALGSVISKLLFILMISSHFLSKRNSLHLVRCWNLRDCRQIACCGIVKASNYALEGLTVFAVNLFAGFYFENATITLLIVAEKFLGLLTIFIGLSMAVQPLIGTLNGEKNNKALCLPDESRLQGYGDCGNPAHRDHVSVYAVSGAGVRNNRRYAV
ncbi:MAG: hypothetical protein IJG40_02320 [Oscillospiraceae bacterium]|nr:hypothetical protein [Oscillospiraceae bacterium]